MKKTVRPIQFKSIPIYTYCSMNGKTKNNRCMSQKLNLNTTYTINQWLWPDGLLLVEVYQ